MEQIQILDLNFLGSEKAIACFLVETTEGPVLIETGPESTFSNLKKAIMRQGYHIDDIRHVLLTHIHFDHAGAAWKFAAKGAKIHVHPVGAPHLASPEKLWESASMIYGDDMDRLWGKMEPIPESRIMEVEDGQRIQIGDTVFTALHTPGHASHHIAWMMDGVVFCGDVGGIKIGSGPVVPPCPPPDIHLEAWMDSIQKIIDQNPEILILTHFGEVKDVNGHFRALQEILFDWANWIKPHFEKSTDQKTVIPAFMEYTQDYLRKLGCSETLIQTYEYANPSWMSVAGLYRYWKLKSQGRL